MTCIVGLVEGADVWMGGDSAACSGWELTVRRDPKVFRKGDFLFGYTSSFRMGQLLRFKFEPPAHPEGMDAFEYLATFFVDALRDCFKEGGYARKQSEAEEAGTFLVGYRGRLFLVQDDYQVSEPAPEFAACGCGAAYALGALQVTDCYQPRHRVEMALATAEAWSAGVRGPFLVEQLAGVSDGLPAMVWRCSWCKALQPGCWCSLRKYARALEEEDGEGHDGATGRRGDGATDDAPAEERAPGRPDPLPPL